MVEPRKSHDFVKRIYTAWSREPDKDADAVGRKWERWRSISRGEIFLPGWVNAQGPIQDPVLALRKKRCTDGPRGTYGLSALNDRIFFQCVRRQRSFRSASGPLKDLFRTWCVVTGSAIIRRAQPHRARTTAPQVRKNGQTSGPYLIGRC